MSASSVGSIIRMHQVVHAYCRRLWDSPLKRSLLTHKQASIRGPVDGNAAGGGVVFLDQIFCCTLEVVEALLLVPQRATYHRTTTSVTPLLCRLSLLVPHLYLCARWGRTLHPPWCWPRPGSRQGASQTAGKQRWWQQSKAEASKQANHLRGSVKGKISFLQTLCWVISVLIISRVFDDLIFARNPPTPTPPQLQTNHTH